LAIYIWRPLSLSLQEAVPGTLPTWKTLRSEAPSDEISDSLRRKAAVAAKPRVVPTLEINRR